MRILHITDASSSGVLTAVTALCRAQARLPGIEVDFVYVPRTDSPVPARISSDVAPARARRLVSAPRLATPVLAARLPALLARPVDVVHLHSSRAGLLGRAAAALTGRRDRTVYSPHCFAFDRSDAEPARRRLLTQLERTGTLLGPRLLLCSDSEEQLARRVLPRSRTAVLSNSVEVAELAAIAAEVRADRTADASTEGAVARRDGAPLRVVHVGRIVPQKRPADFTRIAADWPRRRAADPTLPPLAFRWLGEGHRETLGPEVAVSGWLPPAALHRELAAADVLLFTSAGEGMPLAVLEAQAMGVPVLAHDVTGVRDAVLDGETGLLRRTADELSDALALLARDPALRARLGAAGAARARSRFDAADLAARSLAAYRRLGIPLEPIDVPTPIGSPAPPGRLTPPGPLDSPALPDSLAPRPGGIA